MKGTAPGSGGAAAPPPGMSVVIPARDAASTLGRQLESLDAQEYGGDWEVIVCDNLSSDATAVIAREWSARSARYRLVPAAGRLGVNHARNTGAAAARFDRIAFVDADDEVAPGWLDAMAGALERHPCVGGEVVPDRDPGLRTLPCPSEPCLGFLPAPLGANCGCRAEVFHALGGFDEAFLWGGNEIEFFWRAQLAGFELGYASDAIVHYRLRSTASERHAQTRRQAAAQVLLFKRFGWCGMPRSDPGMAVKAWTKLLLDLPRFVLGGCAEEQWRHEWARRAGRLEGSVAHRTLYL